MATRSRQIGMQKFAHKEVHEFFCMPVYPNLVSSVTYALCQLFIKFEDIFDLFLPIPRREDSNGYCRSIRNHSNYKHLSNREIHNIVNSSKYLHHLMTIVNPGTPEIESLLK